MASVSFTGMSSGLDTDSIVEAMCATSAHKVTKSEQAEATIELKQEVWKDINSKVYSFYTGLDKIRMAGNFSTVKTTSSATGVATIASSSALEEGNHTLTVTQLAEKATLNTKKISYTVTDANGTSQKMTAKKTTTLGEVLGKGGATGTTIKATGTDAQGNSYAQDIVLEDSMTIADLEKQLSSALGHCSVKYNESLGTFSVYSKETGADQTISLTVTGNNPDALVNLGFTQTQAEGKNLEATYNGMQVDHASNDFEVSGTSSSSNVKISVTGVGTTTISATKDTDGVFDMIKNFVDEYNSLLEEISKLVDADSTNLEPLTEDKKESMSEKEIEEHNEKLKAAALRNDSTLQGLRTSLRNIISDESIFGKLNSIGITTSSNYKENGKLVLDEDKLKEAIQNRPDEVTEIFTSRTSGSEGIATKLYSKLQQTFKGTTQKSTGCLYNDKVLTKNLKAQQKQTATLEERLEALKQRYYSKFTAMETMLATINSQSSTISSYFSF